MKKVLLFAALFAMSRGAYAQNGGLCIDNTKDPCDVVLQMYAIDPSTSVADGVPCAILSNWIVVAAGTESCWNSVWSFQSPGPGWWSIPSGSISATSTEFNWTDVGFQFQCPSGVISSGCSDEGGFMTDNLPPVSAGGCYEAGATWTSIPLGGCREAFWNDYYAAGGYLDNVTLVFE